MSPLGKKCVPRMALVPFDIYLKDISTHFVPSSLIMWRPGPLGLLGGYATAYEYSESGFPIPLSLGAAHSNHSC